MKIEIEIPENLIPFLKGFGKGEMDLRDIVFMMFISSCDDFYNLNDEYKNIKAFTEEHYPKLMQAMKEDEDVVI